MSSTLALAEDVDLHTQQITLLPTSSKRLSISPALSFAKDQTQAGIVMVIATKKEIKAVNGGGVNNGGNMD